MDIVLLDTGTGETTNISNGNGYPFTFYVRSDGLSINKILIRKINDFRFGVWYSFTNIYQFDMKLLSCKSKSDTTISKLSHFGYPD
jgi:hypothetical protein